jgi:hypothetical protein
MSEPVAVEARLFARVESILNGAAFRKGDREDLAEELYGHLWQRWQDALASGLDEETAADQAIRSFGEPAGLSRDVTLAYHSRLYASTIGVLLPTVVAQREKPRAYWVVWLVHLATFMSIISVWARALMEWTPLRAGIGIVGCLMAFAAVFAAFAAYGARQRWALGFARLELPFLFWWAAVLLWAGMPMEQLGAGAVGLMVGFAVVVFSQAPGQDQQAIRQSALVRIGLAAVPRDLSLRSLSNWMYERPIPRRLLVGLATLLIVGSALPVVALNVADPTQIGPADVQVGLSVACTSTASGNLTAVDVTGSFVFKRTDVWPNGMLSALQGGGPTDEIAWAVEGSRPNGVPMITPMLTRAGTALDATDGSPLALGSPENRDGRAVLTIPDSARLQAGHRYEVTWNYSVGPGLRDTDLTPVVFGYNHLDRFYLQATAGCGQTGIGRQVPRLLVIGP